MAATYSNTSPWYQTKINNNYLMELEIRSVPAEDNDFLYTLEPQYTWRPDLLSYDLYGTPKLWWVFIQRNMDVLSDPIFDFVPGIKIFLPKKSNLIKILGL